MPERRVEPLQAARARGDGQAPRARHLGLVRARRPLHRQSAAEDARGGRLRDRGDVDRKADPDPGLASSRRALLPIPVAVDDGLEAPPRTQRLLLALARRAPGAPRLDRRLRAEPRGGRTGGIKYRRKCGFSCPRTPATRPPWG